MTCSPSDWIVVNATEARKDGLTTEDLETGIDGEVIEDYGVRALLLSFTEDDSLPYHPDTQEWESNWKRRKQKKRR